MYHKNKTYALAFGLILVISIINGCSTKKNTPLTRTYHGVTAYYNVYYNGKDAYSQGLKKIETGHKDNYSMVLPIFFHSNKDAARAAFGDMNRAVEKGSKCIRKHSITVKPKQKEGKRSKKDKSFLEKTEYIKWIDDAYMLIAKAHFHKHDYFPAIETFSYIIREYNDQNLKTESYIWLARTYTEMGKLEKALEFIAMVENEKVAVPEHLLTDFYSTKADILFKSGKINETITELDKCVEVTKNKKIKTRYLFILAQLYSQLDENKKAFNTYTLVLEQNPSYEMAFNAEINRAMLFNSETTDSRDLQKKLFKMLKDDKNIDFRDQIYYALGSIAQNENRLPEAVNYYKESAKASTINNNQKAVSFLAVADIYFDEPQYVFAQAYYDSAVSILSNDYPNFNIIKLKSENLNSLIENIQLITTQDSLQKIAKMPEDKRNNFIDNLIKKIIEQEQIEKELAAQQKQDLLFIEQQNRQLSNQQQGKWYLYNPAMLASGQAEFKKKWGNRKLEDNWRRKNKAVIDFSNQQTNEQTTTDSTKIELSNKTREYYLVNLPLTDSAIIESDKIIEEAYFNIGEIYNEKFNDYEQSIANYNQLLEKFPQTELKLSTYYNLYKLYVLTKDYKLAEHYKKLIIDNYSNSDYAKILSNPEYFKQLQAIENQVNFIYQATYKYFLNDNCTEVDYNFHYVDTTFSESPLVSKFALLSTLCSGKLGDTIEFKKQLGNFIKMYPGTDETIYAQNVLEALDRKPREVKTPETPVEQIFGTELADNINIDSLNTDIYSYNANQLHYYIIIVNTEKADDNRLRFNVSNFNIDYYSFLEFDVSSVLLSANYSMIVVKSFKNKNMATNYMESVVIAGEVFENYTKDSYKAFIISANNFAKFYDDKNLLRYEKFFKANY